VDLTYGTNLFPSLSLLDNIPSTYPNSLQKIYTVLTHMKSFGISSLLISVHRSPENNFNDFQTFASFVQTVQYICTEADKLGITVHLRQTAKNWSKIGQNLNTTVTFVKTVDMPNLFIVPNTGLIIGQGDDLDIAEQVVDEYSKFLGISTPIRNIAGSLFSENGLLSHYSDLEAPILSDLIQRAVERDITLIYDSVYRNSDEEYLDTKALDVLLNS